MTLYDRTLVSRESGPRTMRAAVLEDFGDASCLRIREVPRPVPVLGEVLVRVVAAGVSRLDVETRAGAGAAAGVAGWPAVLGHDFSGVVESAPYAAFRLRPGDEVFGVSGAPRSSGSFAEYVAVPAHQLAIKPKSLSHAEAATVPLAASTAWGAVVELARAHEGQRILVHGAAGGVGHLAVQLAAYFGAHVVATSSGRDLGWLREMGASETIDTGAIGSAGATAEVDAVVDLVGEREDGLGLRPLDLLRPGGLLISVPLGGRMSLQGDADRAGVRATGFDVVPDSATLAVVGRLISSGDLRVAVHEVYPFDRLADAQRAVESGHLRGRIAVRIADS